jgi:hypothetical protein
MSYTDLFEESPSPSPSSADHLVEDPDPILSQRYVLLSFAEPQKQTAEKRELFIARRFLKYFYTQSLFHNIMQSISPILQESLSENKYTEVLQKVQESLTANTLQTRMEDSKEDTTGISFSLQSLEQRYDDYRALHFQDDLKAFQEQLGTEELVVHGIKFRGAFGTLEEASARAQFLRRMKVEPYIDVFASEGFKWVPRNPNPFQSNMKVQYGDDTNAAELTSLNNLMKTFKEQDQQRREQFERRRKELAAHSSSHGQEASNSLFNPDHSVKQ